MAKIQVQLNAFYGFGHGGCSHGSEETIMLEVNDQELEALRKLSDDEVACEAVVKAIENGETALIVETDEPIAIRVFDEYYKLLDKQEK